MEVCFETPGGFCTSSNIHDQILSQLGKPIKVSRSDAAPLHNIKFVLEWDLVSFHQQQQYSSELSFSDLLANAVVLTGSQNNVQASTCIQYVCQIWPVNGGHLIRLLQCTLESETDTPQTSTFEDSSKVTATQISSRIIVEVTGNPYFVADIGQQLAWLGAALRSSPNDQGVTYCRPAIADFSLNVCELTFQFQPQHASSSAFSGSCWRNLFNNPVVVEGYPIPRRPIADSGLEISLDVLSVLTNSRLLIDFCGRTCLKGFSTMLVAMETIDEMVFWHMFFNENGTCILYEDARVPRDRSRSGGGILTIENLADKRNILGWCENVSNYADAPDANYDLGWSGLRSPHSSCAFEKVSISAGKFINVGTSIAIARKQKPVYVIEDDYVKMLLTISKRYFVFHGVDDRRAWLIDGASALLHLLRASIKDYQSNRHLRRIFKFDCDKFEEATPKHTRADAAMEVLFHKGNQNLPLYPKTTELWTERTTTRGEVTKEYSKEKDTNFYLKDRVTQICIILGQIMAHQDDVHSESGVGFRLRSTPRRQIEGFDFMDIAAGQGTLWPKVANLHATGAGWVDFTRKIHAISLFGTRFGDSLKPKSHRNACRSCLYNQVPPGGQDYLTVSVAELEEIIKKSGNILTHPWLVVDGIYWHTPDKVFERCGCSKSSSATTDRVQVLLPASFPNLWGRKLRSPEKLTSDSAVIFGHSWKYPLCWGSTGHPEVGTPDTRSDDVELNFYDSGIGSGHHSSNLDGREESSGSNDPSASSKARNTTNPGFYSMSNDQFVHRGTSRRQQ